MNLAEKLEAATKEYEEARTALEGIRAKYLGPQKEFAETKANLSSLQAKIKEAETSLSDLKAKMGTELRASNGETTDAVKKVLSDRRNTDDLLEELRIIAQEVEKRVYDIRQTISPLATAYEHAYHRASVCWSKANVYRALVECAPQLRAAMAVVPSMSEREIHGTSETAVLYAASLPENIILKEITGWIDGGYDAPKTPYQAELGHLDLGALKKSEVLTPGMKHVRNTLQGNDQA